MELPEKKIQEQLPDDIWSLILLRLPAITLIELKIVCKSWYELINSKNFQISHLEKIRVSAETKSQLVTLWPSPPALLSFEPVSDDDINIPSKLHCRPLTFDQPLRRSQRRLSGPPESETNALHCADGLLLVRTENQLFLCNPLTKSYLYLPFPKKNIAELTHHWTWTLLVYDPSSQGYVIFYVDDCTRRSPRVFSLRIGSGRKIRAWRQVWSQEKQTLTFPFPENRMVFFLARISINGKVHFLIDFVDMGILTIDSESKSKVTKCSATPTSLGVFLRSGRKFYGLNESSSREAFELWVIDDVDNPTWSKRHVISNSKYYRIMLSSNSGWILREGDGLIIYLGVWKRVFIYDISLDKWQEADIVGKPSWNISDIMPIHYSLFSWN